MDPSSNPGPTGAEETATRAEQLVQFAAENQMKKLLRRLIGHCFSRCNL